MPQPKYDHKTIGRELDLFSFSPKAPGFVFWHPKGTTLFNLLIADLRKSLFEQGYQEVITPVVLNSEILKRSGHFANYKDKIFYCGSEQEINEKKQKWVLKPMNCPGTLIIFASRMRSYKDLPAKFSEFGSLHRYEQAGEINGLFRVRQLTVDDAHIFCTKNQMLKEITKIIKFIYKTYDRYGFSDIYLELSTRPKKSIGTDSQWRESEVALKKALKQNKLDYKLNIGEGAFYGPKIDFHIQDCHDRSWQLGTIQLDFSMPELLDTCFINEKGKKEVPVMIHRAIFGSLERFIAILLEHTGGKLPMWVAPIQSIVLPISERHLKYAQKVAKFLLEQKIRVEIDYRNETISKKIRDAEIQKIPYMAIVGDREIKAKKIAVRELIKGDLGQKSTKWLVEQIISKNV